MDAPTASAPPSPFVGVHGFGGLMTHGSTTRPYSTEHDLPRCQAPFASAALTYDLPSTVGAVDGSSRGGATHAALVPATRHAIQPPSEGAPEVTSLAGHTADPSATTTALAAGGAQTEAALHSLRGQIATLRAERDALSETLRLTRREVGTLRRASEAEAATKMALLSRLDGADERVGVAESRRGAFQALAEAQAKELDKIAEQLDLARTAAEGASRLQITLEAGAAGQNERHQLLVRGEAMMREELQRAAVENEELRTRLRHTAETLTSHERLVASLGDRLDAQAELARLQIGLSPLPFAAGGGGELSVSMRSGVGGASNPSPPRLVRIRISTADGSRAGGARSPTGEIKRNLSAARLEAARRADAALALDDSDNDSWRVKGRGDGAQATGSSAAVVAKVDAGFRAFSLDAPAEGASTSTSKMWWELEEPLGPKPRAAGAAAADRSSLFQKERGVSFRRRLSNYEYEVPDMAG